MDQSTAVDTVAFFGRRLVESGIRVSRLILFGSHPRGAANDESDVDVLVISEDFRGKNVFDRAEIICDPERETIHRFQVPLDVITMTPEEFESGTSLIAQAAREGTIVLPETWESASNMSRAL